MKFGWGLFKRMTERLSRRVPFPFVIAFLSLCLGVGAGVGMAFLFAPPEGGRPVIADADRQGISPAGENLPRKPRPFRPPRVVFKHPPPERQAGFGEQPATERSIPGQAPVTGTAGAVGDKDTARAPSQEVAALPSATIMPIPDDRLPWRRNAVKVSNLDGRPVIAVVIDDMGLDRRRSARALALPGPLTLAYLPYGSDLRRQTEAVLEEGEHIGSLDDFACVHDQHVTCELCHDAKIVRDQEDGHAHVVLQGFQQVENLRLNGHIERSGRLIRNEQVGAAGEGHGDHYALLHPT